MSTAPAALGRLPADVPSARTENATMAIVGIAHGTSHFFHLTLAPLFPWLKDAFSLSYSELGLLVTVFFIISASARRCRGSSSTASAPGP
jgi:FSR family fosmidomycin resistance protein-like MFS transporter